MRKFTPGKARKYQRYQPGVMNKTERRYADILNAQKIAGEINEWWYEAVTFKLAKDCRYTPDFLVQMPDGSLEIHEVKGARIIFRDDARVKVKMTADKFPFRCFVVFPPGKKSGKTTWDIEEFEQ